MLEQITDQVEEKRREMSDSFFSNNKKDFEIKLKTNNIIAFLPI